MQQNNIRREVSIQDENPSAVNVNPDNTTLCKGKCLLCSRDAGRFWSHKVEVLPQKTSRVVQQRLKGVMSQHIFTTGIIQTQYQADKSASYRQAASN